MKFYFLKLNEHEHMLHVAKTNGKILVLFHTWQYSSSLNLIFCNKKCTRLSLYSKVFGCVECAIFPAVWIMGSVILGCVVGGLGGLEAWRPEGLLARRPGGLDACWPWRHGRLES